MAKLKNGENIKLQSGVNMTVLKQLGEGGQGCVYEVKDASGHKYALKWYKSPDKWMYNNIKQLIEIGSPSHDYIWPQMLTQKKEGYFGYLMKLRPPEYEDIMKGKQIVDFNKFDNPILTKITVAIKICIALKKLHASGLVFYDLNDGGFFINPKNGEVLICDCDNVSPLGSSNMGGMMRFKAPEIVEGNSPANKRTDYFSLSIVLFLLLYGNHPLEGANAVSYPCFTPKVEKEVYGRNAVFICDPENSTNRPVKNIHTNVLNWWNLYPKNVNNAFIDAFSKESIQNPENRIRETEWVNILSRARDLLVRCSCGEETFARKEGCYFCKSSLNIQFGLEIKGKKIPIKAGKFLYASNISSAGNFLKQIGKVVVNKKSGQIGLKNISNADWSIESIGKIDIIKNSDVCILEKGKKISLSNETTAIVI
ncbi:MAG: serine/threonine protein kinase [Flavobacteriales bacterium]|nr:serine/threonine protein kinase [Flavobacteriales bacterium]